MKTRETTTLHLLLHEGRVIGASARDFLGAMDDADWDGAVQPEVYDAITRAITLGTKLPTGYRLRTKMTGTLWQRAKGCVAAFRRGFHRGQQAARLSVRTGESSYLESL